MLIIVMKRFPEVTFRKIVESPDQYIILHINILISLLESLCHQIVIGRMMKNCFDLLLNSFQEKVIHIHVRTLPDADERQSYADKCVWILLGMLVASCLFLIC